MSAAWTARSSRGVAGYQLESVLGRGRHAIVYLALHPRRGRRVALKVAHRKPQGALDRTDDLRAEFSALTALPHPHVIQAFDHGVVGTTAYLAMECAAAGHAVWSGRTLGTARTMLLLGQGASALAWLHQQGWVHRDVKPSNLLLRADGSLALCDFGSACRRDSTVTAANNAAAGSPQYAAPEQSEGAPCDPAQDVYSLGACLYEMLCGRPLYPGQTATELLGQHLLAPVPSLPPALAAWQPLLAAMVAKDPRQRLPDGQAVLTQLERIQNFLPRNPEHDARNPS